MAASNTVTRKPIIGGNWKSNGLRATITDLVSKLNDSKFHASTVEVVIAPGLLHLSTVASQLSKAGIAVGAQNCSQFAPGAFTGEVNAQQLKDFGIEWVIIGHSERRHQMKETDKDVSDKVKAALSNGLQVIACCGELLAERKANQTIEVVTRQLKSIAEGVTKPEDWTRVVIAYEPVWAIGTGQVATPAQAQAVHASIREWLSTNVSSAVAAATRIIYGGSVTKDSCDVLFVEPDIDGFLVGGASLKADEFRIIIESPARKAGAKKAAQPVTAAAASGAAASS